MRECRRCGAEKALVEFPIHGKSGAPIKTCKACMPQYQTPADAKWLRDSTQASRRSWTMRNAEKRAAHKAVEYAIARGDVRRQPCERCGTEENVHAHHDDYSKPLEVMWLCHRHHMRRHRELGAWKGSRAKGMKTLRERSLTEGGSR